MKKKTNFYT